MQEKSREREFVLYPFSLKLEMSYRRLHCCPGVGSFLYWMSTMARTRWSGHPSTAAAGVRSTQEGLPARVSLAQVEVAVTQVFLDFVMSQWYWRASA